jgi:hypothetical protein
MSEYSLQYIIIEGQKETGDLRYIGPFDNEEDAEKEAARFSDTNVCIVELFEPTFGM